MTAYFFAPFVVCAGLCGLLFLQNQAFIQLSLCLGAEHERGEEQRQVEDADFEQVAG